MEKVNVHVLLNSVTKITAKLYKDSTKAKIHKDNSKDKQQVVLFAFFNEYMEELTSGEISEQRTKVLEDKINKVLDEFSELTQNKKLKKQINDAFKKRLKSKGEKKPTLKSSTIKRLNASFAAKGLEKGSFDSLINQLLTQLGVPELLEQSDTPLEGVSAEVKTTLSPESVADQLNLMAQPQAHDVEEPKALPKLKKQAAKERRKKKKQDKKKAANFIV